MGLTRPSTAGRLAAVFALLSGGGLICALFLPRVLALEPVSQMVMAAALTLLTTGGAWLVATKAVSRPMRQLAHTVAEHLTTDSGRLNASRTLPELEDLVESVNTLLGLQEQAAKDARKTREEYDQYLEDEPIRIESAVVERTQDIREANEDLQSAAFRAIEANERTNQVIADMTHELRTPLNGVMGMAELLLMTDLNPKQLGYTRTVLESSEDLLTLVNNILDFSKVEAGKLERLDSQPFSPGLCVDKVHRLMAARAEMKGLTLSDEGTEFLPPAILGDSKRLRQVLINIVGNAIKFTETGSIVVRTTLTKRTDQVSTIRFEVVDTGIGIPGHLHAHVFEKFSQVDRSTTRQFGGAGLGLSIAKHLVELMGGEIGVISQPGVGSNFWFTIQGEHRRPATAADADLGGIRALVVGATHDPHSSTQPQLTASRASCIRVQGAQEALAAIGSQPFDVVVLDMPTPDAFSFASEIRPREPDLPPLILVSSVERKREELKDVGIAGWVRKPPQQKELAFAVAAAAGRLDVVVPPDEETDGDADISQALAGARILVADDHPVNREVTTTLLETLKCCVDIAEDGVQAVEMAEREAYDLVLLDCEMPRLDGYDAAVQMRTLEKQGKIPSGRWTARHDHLPILAVTAHTSPRDRARSRESGMDDFVCKPFTLRIIQGVLMKWLVGVRAESDTPSPSPSDPADAPSKDGVISEEAIEQILELDRLNGGGVFARFARTFLETVPSTLEQLRDAVRGRDVDGIARSAHALTGASLNIGAEAMAALSGELQAMAKEGRADDAEPLAARLESQYLDVKAALEARLRKERPSETETSV